LEKGNRDYSRRPEDDLPRASGTKTLLLSQGLSEKRKEWRVGKKAQARHPRRESNRAREGYLEDPEERLGEGKTRDRLSVTGSKTQFSYPWRRMARNNTTTTWREKKREGKRDIKKTPGIEAKVACAPGHPSIASSWPN